MMRVLATSLVLAVAASATPLLPTLTERRTPITLPLTARTYDGPGDLKVFGQTQYGISVSVGTPPQNLWLQVDLNSGDLVVLGDNCYECNSTSPRFFSNKSSTYRSRDGDVTTFINNGTAIGPLAFDTVAFGGMSLPNQPFINACKGTGAESLEGGLSGVLGLGWPDDGAVSTALGNRFLPTVAETLAFTQWASPQFGIELSDECGAITFGGVDESKFVGELTYTPTVNQGKCQNSNWTIGIEMIYVGGKAVSVTTPGAGLGCEAPKPQPSALSNAKRQSGNFNLLTAALTIAQGTRLPPAAQAALSIYYPGYQQPNYQIFRRQNSSAPGDSKESKEYIVPCNSTTTVSLVIGGMRYDFPPDALVGAPVEGRSGMCHSLVETATCGPTTTTITPLGQTTEADLPRLGLNFLKHLYTSFSFDPPSVGFAPLKTAQQSRR